MRLIYTEDAGLSWSYEVPAFIDHDGARHQVSDLAAAGQWQALVNAGVYREWTEDGDAWLGYTPHAIEPNPEPEDDLDVAARYLAGSEQDRKDAQREDLREQINNQIPQHSATDTLRNQLLEGDITRTAGAATEKQTELDHTADADLDAFDVTLSVAEPQDDAVLHSRMTSSIAYLEPWNGAPNDDIGLAVGLELDPKEAARGDEARVSILTGPGAGGVIPFNQSPDDPSKWDMVSQPGYLWSDPDTAITFELLWGAGSLAVTPRVELTGIHDRRADFVRYSVASSSRGRRR